VFGTEPSRAVTTREVGRKRNLRMKLLSVNVSPPKQVTNDDRTVTTGIFKEPVDGRVMLRTLNLDGDG